MLARSGRCRCGDGDVRVTSSSAGRRHNLPSDVTSLVGRRAEIAGVRRLLGGSRLVTLAGVGGVGKTRLAVAAAREVVGEFPDGVRLVELDGLADADLLALTVASALPGPTRDSGADQPDAADLVELIGAARLLIVLDNCEHLVHEVGRLVAPILRACPGVRVLATSREALGIAGESVFMVPPLGVSGTGPRGAERAGGDAVALFAQRAVAIVPDFALTELNAAAVAAVCRRLDGLPLAIELAAVLLRTFSIDELLARQDHHFELLTRGNRAAPPRHQTLRGAVAWSYDLCTGPERLLWARLSVFRGGFPLDLAEAVCGGPGIPDLTGALAGLVDKSVVSRDADGPGPARYRILQTIRDFGREQLRVAGELVALEDRYRAAYLDLAERTDALWFGPEQVACSRVLRAEHTNLRAVLELCATGGDAPGGAGDGSGDVPGPEGGERDGRREQGLRTAVALSSYWLTCGYHREGRHWLDRFLSCTDPGPAPGPLRARAGGGAW